MSARTRALETLSHAIAWNHPGLHWVIDRDEHLAHRVNGRVYAVILPATSGATYEVIVRDLISGIQIKHVRELTAAAALDTANKALMPL